MNKKPILDLWVGMPTEEKMRRIAHYVKRQLDYGRTSRIAMDRGVIDLLEHLSAEELVVFSQIVRAEFSSEEMVSLNAGPVANLILMHGEIRRGEACRTYGKDSRRLPREQEKRRVCTTGPCVNGFLRT